MIKKGIEQSIEVKQNILKDGALLEKIQKAANIITEAFQQKNRVYFCGNGGSAADAQHLAAELSGRFYFDRPALPAEACHVNPSFTTAVSNDYDYESVFSRYIEGFGEKGDILVGISTSGNSGNILKALATAKSKGMFCIGFTGSTGGKMKNLVDILINVPSNDTPRIQESHITIGHIICEIVEQKLFG
ncbi:MAG: D-sedoheptulose 7-phosphate isomerase [Prolixibacteraceae bacterium]|nr:D-sedoheptulose 7-phosphate isomerase [Prolixibacteraceae bacterium]MBN2773440.1 D-sedoheptulose 7-phosphate isomerase [Prolixibacteraceae bacterium]